MTAQELSAVAETLWVRGDTAEARKVVDKALAQLERERKMRFADWIAKLEVK